MRDVIFYQCRFNTAKDLLAYVDAKGYGCRKEFANREEILTSLENGVVISGGADFGDDITEQIIEQIWSGLILEKATPLHLPDKEGED